METEIAAPPHPTPTPTPAHVHLTPSNSPSHSPLLFKTQLKKVLLLFTRLPSITVAGATALAHQLDPHQWRDDAAQVPALLTELCNAGLFKVIRATLLNIAKDGAAGGGGAGAGGGGGAIVLVFALQKLAVTTDQTSMTTKMPVVKGLGKEFKWANLVSRFSKLFASYYYLLLSATFCPWNPTTRCSISPVSKIVAR
jgi:hypothetical protein